MTNDSYMESAAAFEKRRLHKLALPLYLAAARESPADPEPQIRAAHAALKLGEAALSAQLLEECLAAHPSSRRAVSRLMVTKLHLGDYREAAALCRRVLELEADNVQALVTLGYLCPVLGTPERAPTFVAEALEAERRHGVRGVDTFFAHMLSGDYATAWEFLHPSSNFVPPDGWLTPLEPGWHGEATPDRTVCIHSFGGLGDVVMFARYVPLVAERAGRVLAWAQPALEPVLRSIPELAGVIRQRSDAGDALFVNALQLPAIFGTTLDTIPLNFPYLRAPGSGPVLPPTRHLRVGLVWAGNGAHWSDWDRSVPAAGLLRPLLSVPGVEWVSLQVGERSVWADELGVQMQPELSNFGDTAFVIDQLDLVISVDTAVANLALAMGVPTWVMPPTYPEFRWGNDGEPSPWYPAVRLFRRRRTDEWGGMIGRMAVALREWAAGLNEQRGHCGSAIRWCPEPAVVRQACVGLDA